MVERRYSDPIVFERKNKGFQAIVQYTDSVATVVDGVETVVQKRRQKSKILHANGVRARNAEAREWRDALEEEWQAEQRRAEESAKPLVGPYIASYIDMLLATGSIERSTATRYREASKHITQYLGSIHIADLTADGARQWVAQLNSLYAPTTVKKALMILKAALDQAERDGLIERNPLRGAKLTPKVTRREPNALDEQGIRRLVEHLDAHESSVCTAVRIALFTGMRAGEVCGLRWCDVDLDRKIVRVRNALGKDNGSYYTKEPKNGGSRRDIPLPETLYRSLTALKSKVQAKCAEAGCNFSEGLYVTGGIDGRFMTPNYLSKKWRLLAEDLGLVGTQGERPTLHDLRHTMATTAVHNGVDIKTVSGLLGHSNAAMTLNIYTSPDPDARRRGMNKMDALLNSLSSDKEEEEQEGRSA